MILRKTPIWLAAILVLAAVLAQPAAVEAQCMVAGAMVGTYTSMGTTTKTYVLKYLNGTYNCSLTNMMNVDDCNASPSANTMTLSAVAFNAATNPSCAWNCTGGCGTVTIGISDGLPVELMEFSVEDETARDAEGAGQDDGAAGADEGAA